MIEKGENIETSSDDGKTTIQFVEEGDHSKVVTLLKEHGAQLSIWYEDAKGMTHELDTDIASGLDINDCNSRDRTPLESEVDNDEEEDEEVLLPYGKEISLFFTVEKGMTDEITDSCVDSVVDWF